MKVALFIDDDKMRTCNIDAMNILTFTVEDGNIAGMEQDILYNKDITYLSVWLLDRDVNEIYIQNSNNELKAYFKLMGIEVKTHDDLKDHPLFCDFVL